MQERETLNTTLPHPTPPPLRPLNTTLHHLPLRPLNPTLHHLPLRPLNPTYTTSQLPLRPLNPTLPQLPGPLCDGERPRWGGPPPQPQERWTGAVNPA
ncbi:unnamed protein product [Gadus morhua 'NCC']